jgi:hypothetical protein
MDTAFWLDNLLAACTTLSALVVIYGGWLYITETIKPLEKKKDPSRIRAEADVPAGEENYSEPSH